MRMLRLLSLAAAVLLATGPAQTAYAASEPAGLEKLWATYPLGKETEAGPTATASDPKAVEPARTPDPAPPAEGAVVQTESVPPAMVEQPVAQEPSSAAPSPRSTVWIWAVLGSVAFLVLALAARPIRSAAVVALGRRASGAPRTSRDEVLEATLPIPTAESRPDVPERQDMEHEHKACKPGEVGESPPTGVNHPGLVERSLEQGGIERVRVVGDDSGQVEILADGSVSIPLLEEQVVVTKRVVVRERIVVRKRTVTSRDGGRGPATTAGLKDHA